MFLTGDDSYQGPPAEGFDESRGSGILGFKATSVGGSGPTDFGFLLEREREKQKEEDDLDDEGMLDITPAAPDRKRVCHGLMQDGANLAGSPPTTGGYGQPAVPVASASARVPPRAPQRPERVLYGRIEGQERGEKAMDPPVARTDIFHYMRGGEDSPEVMRLLEDEDAHADAQLQHHAPLREALFEEMRSYIAEVDQGVMNKHPGGWGYFYRMFEGKPYSAHYRRKAQEDGSWGPEQLVIDNNALAVDADGSQYPYCSVKDPTPSPSHTLYAYAIDTVGGDAYDLRIKAVEGDTREVPRMDIKRVEGSVEWGHGDTELYYLVLDDENRSCALKRHVLGSDPTGAADVTILFEQDKRFSVGVGSTGCKRFLLVSCSSSETSETQLLDLEHPSSGLRMVAPRKFSHRYSVDHSGGWLYIVTNKDEARDSKLCRTQVTSISVGPAAPETWEDVWTPDSGTTIESHRCFQDFVLLEGRESGMSAIFVWSLGDQNAGTMLHTVRFPDAAAHSGTITTPRGTSRASASYAVWLGGNPRFDTDTIRCHYSSFTVPECTYDYHVPSRRFLMLKQNAVKGFDSRLYKADCITTRRRGVPISLVYRKDIHPDGLAGGPFPCVLTGYGAYGCCQDPSFDPPRLALLNRGVVYAVAHVRGGGEFGRAWYAQGRYMHVKNRFEDFVDAAESLVDMHIAEPKTLTAWGTSSGGLLVSASVNLRPDLFAATLLEVPFVDVINTMSDPTIPLTVGEWEEIGNANEREYFYYMLEYSPYENLRFEHYPPALVTASLHDTMVGCWEPLKYVSKLRLVQQGPGEALLKVNFHAGHGSASDRYECLREAALEFAFLLEHMGIASRASLQLG